MSSRAAWRKLLSSSALQTQPSTFLTSPRWIIAQVFIWSRGWFWPKSQPPHRLPLNCSETSMASAEYIFQRSTSTSIISSLQIGFSWKTNSMEKAGGHWFQLQKFIWSSLKKHIYQTERNVMVSCQDDKESDIQSLRVTNLMRSDWVVMLSFCKAFLAGLVGSNNELTISKAMC